jgi:hypothetical protein
MQCKQQGRRLRRVMRKMTLLLAGALLALAPFGASAAVRVFVGPPAFGYGFHGPYWGPGYYGYYGFPGPYENAGTVKIDSKANDAEVFINGSYAGTVKDNKTMHLRQGNYRIEVRRAGETTFSESVYVTAGKTLHINPAV